MSLYEPKLGSLRAVKHEPGPHDSAPVWWVHDEHGKYDGPWSSEADAWAYIHDVENWLRR